MSGGRSASTMGQCLADEEAPLPPVEAGEEALAAEVDDASITVAEAAVGWRLGDTTCDTAADSSS